MFPIFFLKNLWRRIVMICAIVVCSSVFCEDFVMRFVGHIGKDLVEGIEKKFNDRKEYVSSLKIVINTISGDMVSVIDFLQELSLWKNSHEASVVVHVESYAIGPGGMLLFIADEISMSPTSVWGDICSGAERLLSVNLIRSKLGALNSPMWANLQWFVDPILDSALTVYLDGDGKLQKSFTSNVEGYVIAGNGNALIVNKDVLVNCGVVSKVISLEDLDWDEGGEKESILQSHFIVYEENRENVIGYMRIDDMAKSINKSTYIYIKKGLEFFEDAEAICIVLELNTPGGEVLSALQISNALKSIDTKGIPVIAFVNDWAISAGALIAYSCRFIVATPSSSMGAAAPIITGSEGSVSAVGEKMKSPLRSEFANLANFFGRDPFIAQAMVDDDIVVVKRYGKIISLKSDEDIQIGGMYNDEVVTSKGKLLTLSGNGMKAFGVANELVKIDSDDEKYPVMRSSLLRRIPNAKVVEYLPDLRTSFLGMLSSPFMYSILILGLVIGLHMLASASSVGIGGAIAAISLFGIFLINFSIENSGWIDKVILFIGIVLLGIEFFVIPGFGIVGLLGLIFLVVGIVLMGIPDVNIAERVFGEESISTVWEIFGNAVSGASTIVLATMVVVIVVLSVMCMYLIPRIAKISPLIHRDTQSNGMGFDDNKYVEKAVNIGDIGISSTSLNPMGRVQFGSSIITATCKGEFIVKNSRVVVSDIVGDKVIVAIFKELWC